MSIRGRVVSLGLSVVFIGMFLFGFASVGLAEETVTITFQSHEFAEENAKRWFTEVFNAYEETHPNIKIEPMMVTWLERIEKLLVQFSAGGPPDIVQGDSGDLATFLASNFIEPLDDYITKFAPGLADRMTPMMRENGTNKGNLYGLPETEFFVMMWVDTRKFLAHGLSLPSSPEEFMNVCKKLTDSSKQQYGYAGTWKPGNYTVGTYHNLWWIPGWGSHLWAEDGTPLFDDPRTVEAMEFFTTLYNSGYTPGPGMLDSMGRETFRSGHSAMYIQGSWEKGYVAEKNPELAKNMIPIPIPTPHPERAFMATWFQMVPKDAKHKEEAFKFLNFVSQDEWVKKHAEYLAKDMGYQGAMGGFVVQPKNAWYLPFYTFTQTADFTYYTPLGLGKHGLGAMKIVENTIQKVIYDNMPVQQAMDEAQRETEELLAE